MYRVKNIWTKEECEFKTMEEVACKVKVSTGHVCRLVREKKKTKTGWVIEKI